MSADGQAGTALGQRKIAGGRNQRPADALAAKHILHKQMRNVIARPSGNQVDAPRQQRIANRKTGRTVRRKGHQPAQVGAIQHARPQPGRRDGGHIAMMGGKLDQHAVQFGQMVRLNRANLNGGMVQDHGLVSLSRGPARGTITIGLPLAGD